MSASSLLPAGRTTSADGTLVSGCDSFTNGGTSAAAGVQIDTVRLPLIADPRMNDLLRSAEAIFELMNRCDRVAWKVTTGSRAELEQLDSLHALKQHLLAELARAHGDT